MGPRVVRPDVMEEHVIIAFGQSEFTVVVLQCSRTLPLVVAVMPLSAVPGSLRVNADPRSPSKFALK